MRLLSGHQQPVSRENKFCSIVLFENQRGIWRKAIIAYRPA